jgi:hypothetical protein
LFITLLVSSFAFGRTAAFGVVGSSVESLFTKWDLSLGTIIYGAIAIAASYGLITRVANLPGVNVAAEWLRLLGTRSLDCFIILCIAVVVVPLVIPYSQSSIPAMGVSLASLAVMTAWIHARSRRLKKMSATGPFSTRKLS